MKRSFISLLLCTALVCCAAFTPAEARGSGSGDLQWVDELLKAPAAEQPKEGPSETDAGRAPDEGDKPAGMTLTDQTAPPTDTPSPTDTPAPTETPRPAETPEPAETAAITGISFNTAKGLTLSVNEKADLSAMLVLKPANASARGLKWTVSDAAAASVSEDGMLSPRMAGTVTVTVTDPASKKSAKLRVTVTQPVESIELSESYLTVFKGKTARITARVLPESASNKKLKWESEDSNVARVSANGTVTGTGAGTTWIHCRATDGTGKEKLIRVTVNVAVKRIAFANREMTLVEGNSGSASWNTEPADATDGRVTWTSSNPGIASVSSDGTVTGKKVGSCVITAAAKDGSGVTAKFTAYVEPKKPVYVDHLWWQLKYYAKTGHFGVDIISNCVNRRIKGYTCEIKCYVSERSTPQTSWHFFSKKTVNPGKRVTSEWSYFTAPGLTTASLVELKVTDVYFADGTYYAIPVSLQETVRFKLNSY